MARFSIKPILGEAVLQINVADKRIICIADLHLGIESVFIEKGLNLTTQSNKLLANLLSIIKGNRFDELIILGDLKHNIPLNTIQEYVEIPKFMSE